jgi:hypothetical protein
MDQVWRGINGAKVLVAELTTRNPNVFYELLERQADKALEGLEALIGFVEDGTRQYATAVTNIESEADDLRRLLVLELDKTFVTPLSAAPTAKCSQFLRAVSGNGSAHTPNSCSHPGNNERFFHTDSPLCLSK